LDADGCFSGTASVDPATGWPTLLYTGVFLKANEAAAAKNGVDPPHGAAPCTRFVESQLAAVPSALLEASGDGGSTNTTAKQLADSAHALDPLLVRWSKLPEAVVRWPPSPDEAGLKPGQKLACWRDPWLVCGAVGGLGGGGARPSLESKGGGVEGQGAVPPPPPPSPRGASSPTSSVAPLASGAPPPTLLLCCGTVDRATDAPTGGAVLAFAAPDGLTRPWRCLGLAAAETEGEGGGGGDDGKEKDPEEEGLGCSLPGRDWEMPRVAWIPLRRRQRERDAASSSSSPPPSPPSPSSSSSSSPSPAASAPSGLHALVMSPDACDQSPVYALGQWTAPPLAASLDPRVLRGGAPDRARFDLKRAAGPWPLDLGRTFYAATVWEQPAGQASDGGFSGAEGEGGRTLLWGWLQEHRPEVPPPPAISGEFDHAGCLSLPRVLTLVPLLGEEEGEESGASAAEASAAEAAVLPGRPTPSSSSTLLDPRRYRIFQEALPELEKVRSPAARWAATTGLVLAPGAAPLRIGVIGGNGNNGTNNSNNKAVIQGTHLDIEAEFEPIGADEDPNNSNNPVVALAFRSWRPDGAGAGVLSYAWRTGELELAFDDPQPTAYDERPFSPAAEVAAARRRVGGKLSRPPKGGEPLRLRVLVDGSVVEVFTGGGEVLSTRIYRGEPPLLMAEKEKGVVAAPPTPTGSEQGGGVLPPRPPSSAPSASSAASAASASSSVLLPPSKAPCPCACGVEVLASGAPVRVRRLEAWEVLRGCLDPLLVLPEARAAATAPAAPADLSSSSMASLLAAVAPAEGQDGDESSGKPTAAEIGRAAVAAVDAAEREAERLRALVEAAAGSAAAAETVPIEDTPLSPPPTRQPSMLAIPVVGELENNEQRQQQQPKTPELSPAFLRAIDLRDAAREEDARQAAARLVVQD
jgi:hypothetical protein